MIKLIQSELSISRMPASADTAPDTVDEEFFEASAKARGHFQVLFRSRPAHEGCLSLIMRMMYSLHAFTLRNAALTTPIFIMVPILRVWLGVFPFIVNRYFGLGFTLYYCIGMPLIYRVSMFPIR